MILAVDPGLRTCGCALFYPDSGRLHAATLVQGPKDLDGPEQWRAMAAAVRGWHVGGGAPVSTVVVERMPAQGRDIPSRTLLLHELTAVGAWVMALHPHAALRAVFPHEWEGNLRRPKDVDQDPVVHRVKSRLSAKELARVELPARSLQHNVYDAVGIGLFHLGRLDRKRVISRE